MMKKVFPLVALIIVFTSCKKNSSSIVVIRIKNSTALTLDSVRLVYDTASYNYGSILSDNISPYHTFNSILDDPAVLAKTAGNSFLAGPLIPPNSYPEHKLSPGKYTLKIFADTSLFYGYNAIYIKE